jgi:hypothetical protein
MEDNLPEDTVRKLYLSKCTPQQHIELLEIEIQLNEEKMAFQRKSPLYSDALKQAALMKRFENHIKDKHDQIKKLKANI